MQPTLLRPPRCAAVTTAAQSSRWSSPSIFPHVRLDAGIIAWLRAAAPVPGFIGFAVGRTTFWDALVALRDNKTTREKAVETIANRYVEWCVPSRTRAGADRGGEKGER